ncbi:MAG: PD-(D/E)XK nuclease family protein [Nanoarchaeota archaeon]
MHFKLSPSSLGLMKDCPRCFWLDKHKIWQRPSGIFPSLPNGMDSILKKHFDAFRDRKQLPPELLKGNGCGGMRLFGDNAEEKELIKAWRDNLKGIKFIDKYGNILVGAVDNILVEDNKLIVLDYKTRGFPLKDNTHEYYQDQLDIYNFLLRMNYFDTEDYSFLLFYIPQNVLESGEIIFDNKLIKMKTSAENGEKLFRKALKVLYGECPSDRCNWCEFVEV